MKRGKRTLVIGGAICAALFAFAFVAAPRSCEWGLAAYFWSGVGSVAALFAVPVVLRTDCSGLRRAALGFAFAALGAGVWLGGLVAANVRIICRLF
ncbi:MAG: hypothetical protein KJ025_09750 [Burkholderiales bacterium]|nr:hypothetical protein [Burkholderiales bacterium]